MRGGCAYDGGMTMRLLCVLAGLWLVAAARACLPEGCTQAVVGMTEGWDSPQAKVYLVEKDRAGKWQRVLGPVAARLGRNGAVWGLGLHTNPVGAVTKKEGDGRTPAGVFRIGGLWTTTSTPVKHHRRIPEVRVDARDLWVSDPKTPHLYNRYVRLDHPATTAWELREQMKQNDYAHSIKLQICHNAPDTPGRPVPGAGSSIFFHIWRSGGKYPTAGCTAMGEQNLRAIIARLNPDRKPVYIMLPREAYARYRTEWRLP